MITHKSERRLCDTVSFHRRAHPVPQPSKSGLRWESGTTGLCPVQSGTTGLCPVQSGTTGLCPVQSGTTGLCKERRENGKSPSLRALR
jgi:hypothetical protein